MAVDTQKDKDLDDILTPIQYAEEYDLNDSEYRSILLNLIAELRTLRAVAAEINDDTQCCLCNAMLVVDDGDGRWDRMDHKPDCVMAAYDALVAEQGRG